MWLHRQIHDLVSAKITPDRLEEHERTNNHCLWGLVHASVPNEALLKL